MKLSTISKRMLTVMCITALVFIAACAIYYRSWAFTPFAVGVLCSVALNIFKLVLLERTVDKALTMESTTAGNYLRFQYFLRFVMTGVLLFAAVKLPFMSLWGAAAGIFTFQISAWSLNFFPKVVEAENNTTTIV